MDTRLIVILIIIAAVIAIWIDLKWGPDSWLMKDGVSFTSKRKIR